MRRFRAYVQPLMAFLAVCILLITAGLYVLSNRLVSNSYAGLSREEVSACARQGDALLARYAAGDMTLDALREAVNPVLNPTGVFLVLLDEKNALLCASETAAQYLTEDALAEALSCLSSSDQPQALSGYAQTHVLVMGWRSEKGTVLAGKSLSAYAGALAAFRTLLLRYVLPLAVVLLAVSLYLSHVMTKPADILVEAAQKLSEGELVQVDEPLPPDLKPIGQAFNRMSRRLGTAINELAYERDMLALVLESLHEGVMAMDEAGDMLHENRAARRLLEGPHSQAYRQVTAQLQQAIAHTPEPAKMQLGERILLIRFSPLPAHAEHRRGAIAMILDITEAERLDRTRRDYVANISHELRTPLTAMRGIGEALRDGLVTEETERHRYDEMMVSEIERLSRLVNDLLELSSLQANPAAFETERLDPNEELHELHDRSVRLAQNKGLQLLLEMPAQPIDRIEANQDRLQQVLTILLDNAIKFTPAGGEIAIGYENTGSGARFFVRDTGVGMDEETRLHCFDRFHQGDKSHRTAGSGLGLAIAREIVARMGARLMVRSTLGEGSEFSFVLRFKK